MKEILSIQVAVITLHAVVWFIVSRIRQRNDVADIAWPMGFILAAMTAWFNGGVAGTRPVLLLLLVMLWGVRLALHIALRNVGKGEDPRYRKWREEWGRHEPWRALLQIFLLQQYLALVVLAPVTYGIVRSDGMLGIADAAGIGLWTIGFLFESLADRQLFRFKSDPANKGSIMMAGLWKYSRHPNYFGEVTLWWGIYLIALAVPGGWMTVIGPVTITFLILGVSGIPMLEKRYEGNATFDEYKRRTSAFFPLPPRG